MIVTESLGAMTDGDLINDVGNKYLDLLKRRNYGRVLSALGFVGSAGAAADSAIELSEDINSLIKQYNPTTDSAINRDVSLGLEGYIPKSHKFDIECIDTFSNACYAYLSFLEQRPGESLLGKIQGAEQTLFESLGTFAVDTPLIEETKELSAIELDMTNDRYISYMTLLGSAALWDCGITIEVDGDFRGTLRNCVSLTPALRRNSWLQANIYIPAGSSLGFYGEDAAAAEAFLGLKILQLTDSKQAAAIEAAKPKEA